MTHHPKERARLPEQARLPLAERRYRCSALGRGQPPRGVRQHDERAPGDRNGRRARRAGRSAARAPGQARDPPALGRPDRVGPRARDGRHVHRLQLSRLLLQEAPQGVRGQSTASTCSTRRSTTSIPGSSASPLAPWQPDVMEMTPDNLDIGGRRQADQAAQPRLHPEPAEEHLARARRPVLRRRLALHRAVHVLRDRHRVADGPCHRGHRRDAAAVGHLLAVGGVQGQGGAPLSEKRETIGMALLRKGHLDINTEDPALVNQAVADLKELYDICNIKVGDLQYQTVPEGTSWLQPGVVGRHDRRLHLLPAQGDARDACSRTGRRRHGQGAGPERLLRDLLDDEEAGALAPLPQLPARQRRRLRELRRLQRLPAAAERDRSRVARQGRRRAGEPREQRPHERRLRA